MNLRYVLFISVVAALGGLLFGYDVAVISGTITMVTNQFGLNTLQSGWFVGCALIGSIVGVAFAGWLSDRFGRKKVMVLAAIFFIISGIGCAIAGNITQLIAYRVVGGIAIGVVSITCPLYISEISPALYRGRMVSLYQLAVTVGFFAAYLVNYYLLLISSSFSDATPFIKKLMSTEVWRAMLGSGTLPSILFLVIIFFIPESPRWLVVKNKTEQATNIFSRIYTSPQSVSFQIKQIREMLSGEKYNLKILLQPGIKRAVIIGISIAILGQFMGVNAVLYYGPSIFESAGLSGNDSLFYQSLVGMVNMVTSFLALLIIDKVGRKMLVYIGVFGMIVTLILLGLYFLFATSWDLSPVFLLVCFLAYIFFCAGSISAVIFVFLSEIYPTKVRGLAMSVAGMALWIGTFLIGQLTPWMLKNLTPSGTFFFFAAMCIPYILIVWKLMPETAGKSLEDIEKFWKNNTHSKKIGA